MEAVSHIAVEPPDADFAGGHRCYLSGIPEPDNQIPLGTDVQSGAVADFRAANQRYFLSQSDAVLPVAGEHPLLSAIKGGVHPGKGGKHLSGQLRPIYTAAQRHGKGTGGGAELRGKILRLLAAIDARADDGIVHQPLGIQPVFGENPGDFPVSHNQIVGPLDLRPNPGGSLNAVTEMARMILPEGLIVYTEDKSGKRSEYTCDGKRQLEVPLVVLVDSNSASASEIMAGAIKDYGIGTLVGTTTFGKGIVQQIMPFRDGSAVKLTISAYYTPNGNNIHGIGIEPDVEYEFDAEAYYGSEEHPDNQLEKAKEVLLEKMK